MTRRALLIGAQTFGLRGVEHDVRAMTAALSARGFTDLRVLRGSDATRDGIIKAYEALIDDTSAGDPVLVYYSGHGGYIVATPGEIVDIARGNRQFIVPFDYRDPAGDDFRGITAIELSVLLGRLTERTRNAVVVLDCCHSALMSRTLGELRPRQLPKAAQIDLEAHVQRQLGAGLRIDLARSTGNEYAVRVVACAFDQVAYELPKVDGSGCYGLLTDAFITALSEAAGVRLSWSRLMARVRQLVELEIPHQRPEAEGPYERVLFEEDDDDSAGSLPVIVEPDGEARLDGAPLLGVQVGDEFAIMPGWASGPADEDAIASVQVRKCAPTAARGPLTFAGPGMSLPPDARAYRTKTTALRIPVRVPEALAAAVGKSMFVRAAEPDEDAPLTVIVSADGSLTVHDRIGPLHHPRPDGSDAARQVVADLNRVGRATALRSIREEERWTFVAPVVLEWGRVIDGKPYPLERSGASIDVGERVYLTVRNAGEAFLYVSLVDIGVAYGITQLTDLAPSGFPLPPRGGEYTFGKNSDTGQLDGVPLSWPKNLDAGSARPETVLALITSQPQDVSVLHQQGVRGVVKGQTPLSDLLAHCGGGATREFERAPVTARFYAGSFEFTLVPAGTQ